MRYIIYIYSKGCLNSVLKPDVTMVMLPLNFSEQGNSLRIHSPYYPCNVPNKQFNYTCDVIAASKQVLVYIFVSLIVLLVFFFHFQ